MDYKLKRFCLVACFSLMVLLLLLVVYFNQESNAPVSNPMATDTPTGNQASKVVYAEGFETEYGYQIGYSLSAFMNDSDFFDKEGETLPPGKERLSLMVTSVEKDLRIQVLDEAGMPLTGEEITVVVEDKGEYRDEDKDGVIYIDHIAAGEYKLYLLPMEEYIVPANITRVNVKNKVEYVAIKDISVLMKTEADINAMEEDTEIKSAVEDSDPSELKNLQVSMDDSQVGIDVSKWNGDIDWDKVREAGVEFVIIRAGYRGSVTGSLVVDPCFEKNIEGAARAGLDTGVYFFTQAINEVEAVEEASMVIELLKKYDVQYPVFIDTEGAGGNGRADGLDAATRTAVCQAFCNTMESEGYRAGVYASRNWYYNQLNVEELQNFYIWLAEYRSEPLYQGRYHMWQYTSKGQVDGIEGNVDMNVSYIAQP